MLNTVPSILKSCNMFRLIGNFHFERSQTNVKFKAKVSFQKTKDCSSKTVSAQSKYRYELRIDVT